MRSCDKTIRTLSSGLRQRTPNAFTVIELLVSITIIAILIALIVPAVMHARAAARRTECKNRLRNLGVAIVNETEAKRRFPVAGYWGHVGNLGPHHNWVVQILPWLEQQAIYDQWKFDLFLTDSPNQELADSPLPILVCPDDSTLTGKGDLSYVVNMGIGHSGFGCYVASHGGCLDLNANGIAGGVNSLVPEPADPSDRHYMFQLGLFTIENWPHLATTPLKHHTLDSLHDGLTHTLMLSESLNAGSELAEFAELADLIGWAKWASPDPQRIGFYFSSFVCEDLVCASGKVDYSRANDRTTDLLRATAINFLPDDLQSLGGTHPFPSSHHTGGVHVVFADGRVHFLSEVVDGRVYAALFSPQGSRIKGPLAQPVVAEEDY